MGHLIDLLIWVFPDLAESLEDWRRTASPVHLVLVTILGALAVWVIFVAVTDWIF